jgi:hypothetical protein
VCESNTPETGWTCLSPVLKTGSITGYYALPKCLRSSKYFYSTLTKRVNNSFLSNGLSAEHPTVWLKYYLAIAHDEAVACPLNPPDNTIFTGITGLRYFRAFRSVPFR